MRCPNCGAPSSGVCRYCKAVSAAPVVVGPVGPPGPQGPPGVAVDKSTDAGATALVLGCLLLLGVIALCIWAYISGWNTFWAGFWQRGGSTTTTTISQQQQAAPQPTYYEVIAGDGTHLYLQSDTAHATPHLITTGTLANTITPINSLPSTAVFECSVSGLVVYGDSREPRDFTSFCAMTRSAAQ
jgi:hypothetical protein